ncbi:MAG: ABC transporter ATP-binding protein [Eubacteriaceae bacterium]|nr:ABC transporter ATP-binding protein [Eubacteriaceae bacterium]
MSIEISALRFSYSNIEILKGINLTIEPGATLSILGSNGSGKTTLLNIIAGLLAPAGGNLLYDGKPMAEFAPEAMARIVGFVPQTIIPAFDYSVLEYVVTGCAPYIGTFGRPKSVHYDIAMEAIFEMGISHLANKSYRLISGGERQQVSIARVIAQKPAYILLDEPTSHLDYGNQARTLNTIKKLANDGYGVVFTTHNPDQALLVGGKCAVLGRDGRLASGGSLELISKELLASIYNINVDIARFGDKGRQVCFIPQLDDDGGL